MSRALITGATAGIGAEFARQLASAGHDLVLVARNADRLDSIARELRSAPDIDCDVIVADLVTDEGMAEVERLLRAESPAIDLLVNSAGFGLPTSFLKSAVDDEEAMLRVFVLAVLRLSHAALPGMVARGRGAIVNVSSVAGFLPGGTYSAAKAWVTAFSEGLYTELQDTDVRVMALCPGYVHTEMHQRMGVRKPGPSWVWLDTHDVVAAALHDLRRGRAISVPGLHWKALVTVVDLLPRAAMRRPATLRRR